VKDKKAKNMNEQEAEIKQLIKENLLYDKNPSMKIKNSKQPDFAKIYGAPMSNKFGKNAVVAK